MHEFKTPEIQDKPWVDALLKRPDNFSCELCFGNLFIWSSVYHNLITNFNGFFIAKNLNEKSNVYSFPIGEGDLQSALDFILADAQKDGKACVFFGITEKQRTLLDTQMPGAFSYTLNRDYFDYVYTVESLQTLSGKKLHGKRNHITNFKKMYTGWNYERMQVANLNECLDMHFQWLEDNKNQEETASFQNELEAVKLAFNHFEELELTGGFIRLDGKIIAYTFGEAINQAVFCTHVEKAFSDVRGAYPLINQEFAVQALSSYTYVNREEDLGLEGLRKAKLSYHPEILLEKMTAVYGGA